MATPNFLHIAKTIDADGIITINFTTDGIQSGNDVYHAAVQVARNGSDPTIPLRGIRLLADVGDPLQFSNSDQAWMFTVRTDDGDAIEVVHMDVGTDASEQIFVPVTEGNMLMTANHTTDLWRGGPIRMNLYTPKTALNSIYATTTGTTAVTSGVDFVQWSYTLEEDETVGGTVRFVGRAIDGGVTKRTLAEAKFAASRSTGGGASVTVMAEDEVGTIGTGTITTNVSGNAVRVTLNYTLTCSMDWTMLADLSRVLP
jgi:hypothetical protein